MNTSKTRALAGAKDPDQRLSFTIYTRFLQLTCLWSAWAAGYKFFQAQPGVSADDSARKVAHAIGVSIMSSLAIMLEVSIWLYLMKRDRLSRVSLS